MQATREECGDLPRIRLPGSATRPTGPAQPNCCRRGHRQHIRKLPPRLTARGPPIPRRFVNDILGIRLFRAERNVIGCAGRSFRHSTAATTLRARMGSGPQRAGKLLGSYWCEYLKFGQLVPAKPKGKRDPLHHHLSNAGM